MKTFGAGTVACAIALAAMAPVTFPALAQTPTIITDDFADRTTGWTRRDLDGVQIDYLNGGYAIVAPGNSPFVLASTGYAFANGTLSVDVANLPGATEHNQGVFLRAQDADNFYAFAIASDWTWSFFRVADGLVVTAESQGGYLPGGVYLTYAPNRISAAANGGEIQFSVNGTLIYTLTDAIWTEGVAGLLVHNPRATATGSIFDNWRVEVTP